MRFLLAVGAFVFTFAILSGVFARAAARSACAGHSRVVVVDARARTLTLCANGAAEAHFPVALGTGGLGKQRRGDQRTPLGDYPLGPPRPSKLFGTFIPVGYPTPDQARAGLTGNAIGIHGPPRLSAWAGAVNTASDWTAGCIAVGSDAEISRIAVWVRARRPVDVRID
jgi:murein L,D-transpeptidase YafK